MGKQNDLNKHAARVVAVLIQKGLYPGDHFSIYTPYDYFEITLTYVLTPFASMKVYPDGIIHFFDTDGKLQYESTAKTKRAIVDGIFKH